MPSLTLVAYDTLDFMLAELWRDGAFDSSLSSVDDEDVEGGYYLWDRETLERVLDDDERRVADLAWRLTGPPPFEHGYLPVAGADGASIAEQLSIDGETVDALIVSARGKLRAERRNRTLPRDSKQLTGWNGIALAALARAGARPDGARYLAAARRLREVRNGPTNLDSAVSEIFLGFQAANSVAAWPKYTASGVRRSSALCRRLAL